MKARKKGFTNTAKSEWSLPKKSFPNLGDVEKTISNSVKIYKLRLKKLNRIKES